MRGPKALRQQVVTEVKFRRYFWNTLLTLSLAYMAGTLLFGDMGLMRYMELNKRQAAIQMELDSVMSVNQRVAERLSSLGTDDFYVEKNARESFGMATKDEYIFIYKD
jgi:cell division protein FtsB